MHKEYARVIERFGISPTAARVYVKLLGLSKASADTIAKSAGTYKANVYEALDKLIERGLVTFLIEGKRKIYMPTNPEKLLSIVDESKQESLDKFEELRKDVGEIMPQLYAKYNSIRGQDIFEVYRGKKGYSAMIKEILKENPKYWKGFGNLQVQAAFPHGFKAWFKKVKFMLFSAKSDNIKNLLNESRKTTTVKITWLPEDLYMPIVWTLFGDNLLILVYEPEIIALRIKSEQIVDTFSNQFDYLWKKHSKH